MKKQKKASNPSDNLKQSLGVPAYKETKQHEAKEHKGGKGCCKKCGK